jgi:predicted metal-dependent hydrolase
MTQQAFSVRKPALDFDREIDRFYMGGDPVKSHIFNALNLLFPDGERYFVKAVHDHAKDISDPQLLRDVRAFAGQEGQHANQHERFFAVMKHQGYRFGRFLKAFHKQVQWGNKWTPRALRLSLTAGAEHYTATMAALVLNVGILEDCDATMRDLITWHAVEEVEHKHVAYDVLVKLYPRNYLLRMLGFLLATFSIFGAAAFAFNFLVRQDLRAGRVTREQLRAGGAGLLRGKEARFRRGLRRAFLQYLKPGFHPSQNDDRALLERYAPGIRLVSSSAPAVPSGVTAVATQ